MQLVKYEAACQALAEAHDVDEVKPIMDKAAALQLYGKQANDPRLESMAAEIKLRAYRRIGEISAALDKSGGGANPQATLPTGGTSKADALKDAGISRSTANRCEQVAKIPEAEFEAYCAQKKDQGKPVQTKEVANTVARKAARDEKVGKATALIGSETYNVIYADPPWQYSNTGVHGAAGHHYPTQATADICAFDFGAEGIKFASDAVLFLWVTSPLLEDALQVIDAWGFNYKTQMVWVKTDLKKPGSGFYVRGRHELLFICTRGSFTPLVDVAPPIGSVITAPVQEHSKKPAEAYSIIERLYPGCNFLELYAREKRDGWESWGNQA